MTVALVLAGKADTGLCGQLAALGVRRVDVAEQTGPGMLTVAAAARTAGERVLICVGTDTVPEPALARLLDVGGTAAFTGVTARTSPQPRIASGALVVDTPDLDALAGAAETLATTQAGPGPFGTVAPACALIGELGRRGVTVRILDAGPDSEGAIAQLVADPAARHMARWVAWRQLTPAALYGISLGLGLVAALWFADSAVHAKLLAIVALAGSFLFARTGSLVAVTNREGRIRPVAGWLGTACGLLTELAIYAALAVSAGITPSIWVTPAVPPAQAIPATVTTPATGLGGTFGGALRDTWVATWGGAGTAGVWRLAIAALLLLGVRKLALLGYEHTAGAPGYLFPRSVLRTVEQALTLPAGERYAVIVLTSVFFGPRLTFLVLLGWGGLAAGYLLAGQIAQSARAPDQARSGEGWPGDGVLPAYRGDGALSRWIGALVDGRLPPLPPVLVGLLVTGVLAAFGLGNLPGILVLTPVEAMMLAALGARHPHDGRLDWLVPALLLTGEGVFLAALGLARGVAPWLVFALLAAVVVRHIDLACRARAGLDIPADLYGLGWEGRMLLAGVAAVAGIVPLAYAVLSGYLWLLFIWDFLSEWLASAAPGP